MKAGCEYVGDGRCIFTVWAPLVEEITLHIMSEEERLLPMVRSEDGYFKTEATQIYPGSKYFYRLGNKKDLPDPASHFQPEGVHGPSQVIDHNAYAWKDTDWKGLPLSELIVYELHVGTFTPEGTFEAIIPRLNDLVETGINAIEIMPISQFPGNRNWGYDGVYPYTVQNSYGTPEQFKKLVDACHDKGIAVILDVVYNHLGPEGNYFSQFGPYFTDTYKTPWGDAINYDGEYADGVRDFFSDNAAFWLENYHLDGLRLDAIHEVYDMSAIHFWEYTTEKVQALAQQMNRQFHMIAESDLNSPKVIKPAETGGFGFQAQWLDDFHHALYVLLDKKGQQYFADFTTIQQLCKAVRDGFVHSGEYVEFRKRKYGRSSAGIPGDQFLVFSQNHDQIGNRMLGERLSVLIPFEALQLAAAVILLSPYVPLLFMGEEYAEDNPFLYFVSHSDEKLVEAVREGRTKDFEKYHFEGTPPDPQDEKTFASSKLEWDKRDTGKHQKMLSWYKELILLRRTHPALHKFDKSCIDVHVLQDKVLYMKRWASQKEVISLFNMADHPVEIQLDTIAGKRYTLLNSAEAKWHQQNQDQTRKSSIPNQIESHTKLVLQPWHVLVLGNTKQNAS